MPLNSKQNHLFVTGTDTDVGKSVVSFLILKAMIDAGCHPEYLKPLQTGCNSPKSPEADAFVIAQRMGDTAPVDPDRSTLYCLPQPKAPWLAAIDAGKKINPDQLILKINDLKKGPNPLIIEGAGGLMVPINKDFLMIDLMACLEIPVVLVARDGLGTINHTLLSLNALKTRGIEIAGVVLTAASHPPTPKEMVAENKLAIERFGRVNVAGHIDRIEDFNAVPYRVEATIKKLLGLSQTSLKE
jgi:dethiobiotin synthetase